MSATSDRTTNQPDFVRTSVHDVIPMQECLPQEHPYDVIQRHYGSTLLTLNCGYFLHETGYDTYPRCAERGNERMTDAQKYQYTFCKRCHVLYCPCAEKLHAHMHARIPEQRQE